MTDYIIIAIIVLAALLGLRHTAKHVRGQGGCCGGSAYKPKKKKLAQVLYQKTFTVEGMHCEHCKNRVEEVVNDIRGVAGRVDLKRGELTVSYAEAVDDTLLRERLARVGYPIADTAE